MSEAEAPEPPVPGVLDRYRERAQRLAVAADGTFVGRLWNRLLEMEFVDRSVALAAKAFVSLLPLLVVVAAIVPGPVRAAIVETFARRFGLTSVSGDVVRAAFATPEQIRTATGVLGLLLVLLYAMSFTTALQRVYLRAWRRPVGASARDKGRGALWLGGLLAFGALLGGIARLITGVPGSAAVVVLGCSTSVGLWWWTQRLMLRNEVRWLPLLPTAVLTGLGGTVYGLAATVWMPRLVESHFEQYGAFGVATSFVSWFVGMAFLIVVSAALAPVLADGDDRFGRWLRGPGGSALEPGAEPALPPPAEQRRLADAFGVRSTGE